MLPWADTLYGQIKNGVLTLSGYSISIREDNGCLLIKDGLKGRSEVELRLPRALCPVSRIIIVRSEGYLTLRAVRWLREVEVSVITLDYDGSPLLMSLPKANVPAKLRRKQALLTAETPVGAAIARSLIAAKVAGQNKILQQIAPAVADDATVYAARIASDISTDDLLGIEGIVSVLYWGALASETLHFGRRQTVPAHWRTFGTRRSSLTGTTRRAVTPENALLNYIYSVAASEITISLHAIGVDPALGVLHGDKDDRYSLSYDLIEPARGIIDSWFFEWLKHTTFSKRDFVEDSAGAVRVTHPLTSHLAMTASLWRGLADDMAQWFYTRLTREQSKADIQLKPVSIMSGAGRRSLQWIPGNSLKRPIPSTCMECGKTLHGRQRKFCGYECMIDYHGDVRLEGLKKARAERPKGYKLQARQTNITTISVREWRQREDWSRDMDVKMQAWYEAEVIPRLKSVPPSIIRKETGVGGSSSIAIKNGRRIPHPRHHHALATLAGLAWPWAKDSKQAP